MQIYQPYRGRAATDWYKGTADAIAQNLSFVERGSPDLVLVLSGDHIYKMNYGWLIAFHIEKQADVTIATLNVSREEATRMGILATDERRSASRSSSRSRPTRRGRSPRWASTCSGARCSRRS